MAGRQRESMASWRRFFAEELRAVAGLESEALVEALSHVSRERFLGQPPWHVTPGVSLLPTRYRATEDPRDLYHDHLVAIRPEKFLNNGVPSILARLIDGLSLRAGARVLHVGCGSGYYTALMAEIVGKNGQVTAVEIEPDVAAEAKENLQQWPWVKVIAGDGASFDAGPGTMDAVLVNASVTHPGPHWLQALKVGGVLMLPMAVARHPQANDVMAMRIVRHAGGFSACAYSILTLYPCAGLRDEATQQLLNRAFESHAMLRVHSLRTDVHAQEAGCVVHAPGYCLSEQQVVA